MNKVANNPFCVWFDGHIKTFKTRSGAEAFFDRTAGARIGVWSESEQWWVEPGVCSECGCNHKYTEGNCVDESGRMIQS